MRDSGREALIGYLLGALEEAEQKEVELQLAEDPKLQSDLAKIGAFLRPLDAARINHDPPAGLAARTMDFIDSHKPRPASKGTAAASDGRMSDQPEPLQRKGRFRWQDILAACALTLSGVLLLFPAIDSTRSHARLLACEDNLRHLGVGLGEYSQLNAGLFPAVQPSGNLAVAGAYAPQLFDAGIISNPKRVVCPASPLAEKGEFKGIPTIAQITRTKDGKTLLRLHRIMGGSYGYHLGYVEGGKLQPTRNQHRAQFALMSDAPSTNNPTHTTQNHDGKGQNVLFEDGHVKFVRSGQLNRLEEDFFTNDDGEVAAGKHKDDSVVAPSEATPFLHLKIRLHSPGPQPAAESAK